MCTIILGDVMFVKDNWQVWKCLFSVIYEMSGKSIDNTVNIFSVSAFLVTALPSE